MESSELTSDSRTRGIDVCVRSAASKAKRVLVGGGQARQPRLYSPVPGQPGVSCRWKEWRSP